MNTEVSEWISWLETVRQVRGSTLDAYSTTLLKFEEFLEPDTEWCTVDATTIENFMGRPRRSGKLGSPATQDRDRAAISIFFKFLQSRGVVETNPVFNVGVPKVRNRQPRAVSDPVWAQLWSSEMPDEDRVWLGLGCFAGLRRREIVSLSPGQVDSRRGLLMYMERKGGNEDVVEYLEMARIVSDGLPLVLPDWKAWGALVATQAALRASERCLITMDAPATQLTLLRASFVDPNLPDPAVVNKRLRVLLKRAGLSPDLFSPHALRHTCVSNLLRCGVPIEVVSDVVGHANIDTTRRYVKSAGRLADWRSRLSGS